MQKYYLTPDIKLTRNGSKLKFKSETIIFLQENIGECLYDSELENNFLGYKMHELLKN